MRGYRLTLRAHNACLVTILSTRQPGITPHHKQGMATKRGGDLQPPTTATTSRVKRTRTTPDFNQDFISFSNTPPSSPSPDIGIDLGDFMVIDTNPGPVPEGIITPFPRTSNAKPTSANSKGNARTNSPACSKDPKSPLRPILVQQDHLNRRKNSLADSENSTHSLDRKTSKHTRNNSVEAENSKTHSPKDPKTSLTSSPSTRNSRRHRNSLTYPENSFPTTSQDPRTSFTVSPCTKNSRTRRNSLPDTENSKPSTSKDSKTTPAASTSKRNSRTRRNSPRDTERSEQQTSDYRSSRRKDSLSNANSKSRSASTAKSTTPQVIVLTEETVARTKTNSASTRKTSTSSEVTVVHFVPNKLESEISVVYEGPGRGRNGSPRVVQSRGIKTQVPVIPQEVEEIEVVEEVSRTQKIEVIELEDCASSQEEAQSLEDGEIHEEETSSDEEEGIRIDISDENYVCLSPVNARTLENTEIDIPDNVLKMRRRLEAIRAWDRTSLGKAVAHRGMKHGNTRLCVMSYNVLAQSLLHANPSLYTKCDQDVLSWPYRWALLQHEVNTLSPDVLLLQEVEAGHYNTHYLPWLIAKGYSGVFKKRTGTKSDGCAVFYRNQKFDLIEHCTVEYNQPKAPEVLDRDNIGVIVRLAARGMGQNEPRNGENEMCFATTHLLYNPKRHDVKLAQMALLMTELDRMCYRGLIMGQPTYCPVVLTGDFNAEPHTALLSFVEDGQLEYQGLGRRTLTRHHTRGSELGLELLPASLGITGACQHSALSQGRWVDAQRGPVIAWKDRRKLEEALINIHHSDRPQEVQLPRTGSTSVHCPGKLTHAFLLRSVYGGGGKRGYFAPGVSTYQNNWVCVDYMMYSRVRHMNGGVREGRLKLLERLTLPNAKQATMFGPLPSPVCPSDHFPLAARFMLSAQ